MEMVKKTITHAVIEDIEIDVCYPKSRGNESFIGVYDIGDEDSCKNIIDFTNKTIEDLSNGKIVENVALDQTVGKKGHYEKGLLAREDVGLFINDININEGIVSLNKWLQIGFEQYIEKYHIDILLNSYHTKIHKVVPPAGGYHSWHSEQAHGIDNSSRYLTWIVYLNDVDPKDGGETEFKFQGIKLIPKTGRVVIWPAGCTHLHRGNAAWAEKYYVTGWFECNNNVDN